MKEGGAREGQLAARGEDASGRDAPAAAPLSEEMDRRRQQLRVEMETRFLTGGDGQYVDYRRIDADASLDDCWLSEMTRDAEEKYFDAD